MNLVSSVQRWVAAGITASILVLFPIATLRAEGPTSEAAPQGSAPAAKKINDPASITVAEAKKLLDTRKDVLLIDVRSPMEFGPSSIPGSRNIPFSTIMEGRQDLPMNKPILMICSLGGRSFAAVQILQEKGYKEVYNLDGGIEAWQRAQMPLHYRR